MVPGFADDGGHVYKDRAAGFKFSVFWKFLTIPEYNVYVKTEKAMKVILAMNVYYFFIRRCMLTGCLDRLVDSIGGRSNSYVTVTDRARCIEIIIVLYVSACQLMPGGHENF